MLKKIFQKTSVLMFFILLAAGCGSEGNSNTNGDIKLSASLTEVAPTATLQASATLTPVQVGSKITFSAVQYSYDAATGKFVTVSSLSVDKYTNPQGIATWTQNFVQQPTATTLQVTALSGGLSVTADPIAIAKFP